MSCHDSRTSHLLGCTLSLWQNPPMFFGSKVNEDPQDFLNKVYKILYALGVSSNEKAELDSTQGYGSNLVHSMEGK